MPMPPSLSSSEMVREEGISGLHYPSSFNPLSGMHVPVRLKLTPQGMQVIDRMGLSRKHRQLFLLIDNQRTVSDLARLMNCNQDEIQSLLQALEKAAVIKKEISQGER